MAIGTPPSNRDPRRPAFGRLRAGGSPTPPPRNPFLSRNFLITVGILFVLNILFTNVFFATAPPKSVVIPYDAFIQQVRADNVTSVTSTSEAITGVTRKAVTAGSGQGSATKFSTQRPAFANDDLLGLLQAHKVTIDALDPNPPTPFWQTLLLSFGPVLLLVLLFVYVSRRMAASARGGAGGILGRFGQSGARLYNAEHPPTTFADVAGIDEVKAELLEVVDFLKEPAKYERLGGTVPKGVLLIGAPGHRQDAAGTGGGGGGRRAVLLDLRVGVHRGDRGGRRLARPRPLQQGARGGARDHLHRRDGRCRPVAQRGAARRQQRRAGADAQPDPHRDGRFRPPRGRHRAGGHQPRRRARPGAAATWQVRPANPGEPARPSRPGRDPRHPHARHAARRGRRPQRDRGADRRHGGRRPAQPRQRGSALGRAAGGDHGEPHRLHHRHREGRARLRAQAHPHQARPRAHRLPRVRVTRSSVCSCPAPTR